MSEARTSSGLSLAVVFALGFLLGGIIALTAYTIYQQNRKGPAVRQLHLPASEVQLPEVLLDESGGTAEVAEAWISQREAFVGPGLVNFFASWCAPCEQEHPVLMRLAAEQIPVYGVLYHDNLDSGGGMLLRLGSPFRRVLMDAHGESAVGYGLTGVPETLVIDGNGEIRGRWIGILTDAAWEEQLQPLYQSLLAADAPSGQQ